MGASVIQFPSRGPAKLDREPLPTNLRRTRAGAVSFTSQEHMGQNSNPARKVIVIRWTAPAAGEAGAYCCRLTDLFLGKGHSRVLNWFGPVARCFSALLNSFQEPSRRVSQAFKTFLRCLVLVHDEQPSDGALHCQTIPLKDRTRCL